MWFGASEATLLWAWEYTRIMRLGTIFALLSLGLSAFITAQGYALWGLLAISIGAVANIFLDPLFIFTLNMGIAGAAWSTVIAEALSGLFVVWFLVSKFSYLHIQKKLSQIELGHSWTLFIVGLVAFFNASDGKCGHDLL